MRDYKFSVFFEGDFRGERRKIQVALKKPNAINATLLKLLASCVKSLGLPEKTRYKPDNRCTHRYLEYERLVGFVGLYFHQLFALILA